MLRDDLLKVCRDSGDTLDEIVDAVADALLIATCARAPDVDDAERDITIIAEFMRSNIRRAHREFHAAMATATAGHA